MSKERLVALHEEALVAWDTYLNMCEEQDVEPKKTFDEFVADYLIANGVIVPPCKVGDIVYMVVNDKRVKQPYECKVIGFWYSEHEDCCTLHLARYVNGKFDSSFSVRFTDIGKIVFLTREEAEKALEDKKYER